MNEQFNKKSVLILVVLISLYIASIYFIIKCGDSRTVTINVNLNDSEKFIKNSEIYSFIVTFEYTTDDNVTQIPCIGAYIGNSSVLAMDSCLGPYRPFKNVAAMLNINNETEISDIGGYRRHHDYANYKERSSDIMIIKLNQNVKNQPITLENGISRTLTFYLTPLFQLYRIAVDKNFKPSMESVTAEKIKDCGPQMYCLELEKFDREIGSFLVAQQNDKYLLLGIEQTQQFQNNLLEYVIVSRHTSWIEYNLNQTVPLLNHSLGAAKRLTSTNGDSHIRHNLI